MNKAELASAIATQTGLTKAKASEAIEAIGDAIRSALMLGDEVAIPGIGKIKATERAGRMGRNPATGESISIPPKASAKLVPSKELLQHLN